MNRTDLFRKHVAPALAGGVTFLLLASVVYLLQTQELRRHQQLVYSRTVQQLSTIRARAESSINKRIAMTAGLRAYVSCHPDVNAEDFARLGAALFGERAGIRSITLQKDNVVTDVYPREGNEVTLGLDLRNHPEQGPAFRQVIASGKAWFAGPIKLVQGGEAFIHRVPVFEIRADGQTGQGRYWGVVSTLIEKKTLVDEITVGIDPEITIAICGLDSEDHLGRYFIGSPEIVRQKPCSQDVSVPNGRWKISAVPTAGWPTSAPLTIPLIVGGLGFSGLCSMLVWMLVRSQNRYRVACHQALAASRAKSEFLANMSHEIRTPMTAILGYTEILHESVTTPGARESVEVIQRNGLHLLDLINDILDISKIEAAQMVAEQIPCSPRQMLNDISLVMQNRASQKQLAFEIDVDPCVPEIIHTDPTRLKQILLNLVSNAIKFTHEGSVRLCASLNQEASRPVLELRVEDTGIGMTPEQIDRLFKPFTQADSSTTRKFGGTGLGLCISKRLAEILGGTIQIESAPGRGSTFRVLIAISSSDIAAPEPLPATSDDLHPHPPTPFIEPVEKPLAGRHILLAEDGHDNQRLISYLLKKNGAEVTIASHGQEAVELLDRAPHRFDLIIMDMQMPVLDGYQAATMMRATGVTLPILALTAHAMSDDERKCLDAGCNAYLTKPIQRTKLLQTLEQLLTLVGST